MKTIYCKKLKAEHEALDAPPFPGELGEKIHQEISAQAWQLWLERQVMLINEYRLNTRDPQSRTFLTESMERFLFSDADDQQPPGYRPEDEKA